MAGNGMEAVAALEASTYDLMLMNVQMPELDGHEATRRIRARELSLAAGMDDYISKPIRRAQLEAVLEVTPSSPNGAVDG